MGKFVQITTATDGVGNVHLLALTEGGSIYHFRMSDQTWTQLPGIQ